MADNTPIVRYFRADAPAVRDAWSTYQAEVTAVVDEAKAFAALFANAAPIFSTGLHGRSFHGLAFDPAMPTDVWTVPNRKDGNVQRPRAKIVDKEARKDAGRVEALRVATALYTDHMPKRKADIDHVYAALGTDWGSMLLGGYSIAARGGALFVRTLAQLGPPCVEITASEYEAAARKEVTHV